MNLCFQGLVVLALELELGLEFFYQQFKARYFGAEFLSVLAGNRTQCRWSLWLGVQGCLGCAGPSEGLRRGCGAGLKPGAYIWVEGFG